MINPDVNLQDPLLGRVLKSLVPCLLTSQLLLQITYGFHLLLEVQIHFSETRSVIMDELVFDPNFSGIGLISHVQNVLSVAYSADQSLVSRVTYE